MADPTPGTTPKILSDTLANTLANALSGIGTGNRCESVPGEIAGTGTRGEVLVVDDTAANLEVVSQVLEDAGYDVAVSLSGDRALKLAQAHPPDLILLDIQMPVTDGFETCRQLKNDAKTAPIPIIFMTALSDTQSKVNGFDLGAVDYITKPFQERELLARVNTHVVLRQINKTLESDVSDRTQKLNTALEQLNESHLQLVQNEKMSALGSMVAGIAHEINNPLGFINSSIKHASSHVQDLLEHLSLYQEYHPQRHETIVEHSEDIDLEFLSEDLPKMLTSMKEATHRLKSLSTSLRTFSRSDTEQTVSANLHEGIDSTLLILKYRLQGRDDRPRIEVVRDYSELPNMHCFPGQLNQVLMNILANAIDMFDEMAEQGTLSSTQPPNITIQTSLIEQSAKTRTVKILIQDNGKGMPQSVKERIFDRLFTTKGVGKGTGLGLAIAHQIVVEKHSGTLTVTSQEGKGTAFCIQLPLSHETGHLA